MRRINIILGVIIAAIISFAGCQKENPMADNSQPILKTTMQSEGIPIAKLTDKNKIEHLFFQKDVQEFFAKENPNAKLVFMEVIDDGKNAGLLYRIYYRESRIAETSIIPVITLIGDTYYYVPPGGGGSVAKTTCTTSDCASSGGCTPAIWTAKCEPCDNGGTCTRTTGYASRGSLSELTDAIQYAVSVY